MDLLGGAVFHLQDYLSTGVCEACRVLPFREKRTILQSEILRALVEGLNQKKKDPNEQSIPSMRHREVVELQLYSQGSWEHNKAQVETPPDALLHLRFIWWGDNTVSPQNNPDCLRPGGYSDRTQLGCSLVVSEGQSEEPSVGLQLFTSTGLDSSPALAPSNLGNSWRSRQLISKAAAGVLTEVT